MNLSEIIKCVNGICNIKDQKIKNIVTDTRKLKKGDLFIALKGNNYDGNDYIEEAIKKGAIACITVKNINSKCIIVKDTYKALYDIGLYLRSKYNIPLIAITGSNGKTTTKELLYNVLSSKYNVLKNESSKNNIIGVSDTLFKLNNKYDLIIMELGTNQMGEINTLSNMCKPTLSIITNIGSSHLEYFKTRKNIFKEKYSIVNGMNNINLIVNGDSKYLKRLDCFKCGINSNNDLIAYNIKEDLDNVSFDIKLDKEYNIKFNNPGRHFINDILLVIKVSLIYGIDIQTIINKINSFKLIEKRMNIIPKDSNVIINDCYNASYESVCAGLSYLFNIKSKKVLILADILELGKHSKKIHIKIII
ncbi:MAG: UDP-N-acetylmuramoyl-tripeptide--D-alanyl-D-alanine ligase [bacterium]|nr:UDP-N-acetylmuramoyl-tripeptide--D-alanyl-D-alanine ligase [bacterium]